MKILLYTTLLFNAIYAQSQKVVVENSDFNLMCQTSSVGKNYSCYLQRHHTDYCKFYEKTNQKWNRVTTLLECSENLSGRVHFVGDVQKGKCNFKVSNVQAIDKGDWGCTVDVNGEEKNELKWTKIIVKSSDHHGTTSNKVIKVKEGNTVSLKCSSNHKLGYCEFVREDKKCCRSIFQDPRCNCGSRNMTISIVGKDQKSCELKIIKASHQDSGAWFCKVRKENHQGQKIILEVTSKNRGNINNNDEDHTDTTTENNISTATAEPNSLKNSTIAFIIVGSVCCVIVCGLISVGILFHYSKKYPALDSTEN